MDFGELIEDLPRRGGMYVIIKDDFRNFGERGIVQIIEYRIQFVRVRVFTVHNENGLYAFGQEVINAVFGQVPCICNLAYILETVFMVFIKQGNKLFVII